MSARPTAGAGQPASAARAEDLPSVARLPHDAARSACVPVPARRRWLATAALYALATTAMPLRAEPDARYRAWPRERRQPAVDLPLLDGTPWSLAAQRGRPVLLNFWASWCAPCRSEMPSLEHLAFRHEAQGLQVLLVNFKESPSTIRRFVDEMKLELPVLRDADGLVARAFGVGIFPTTVLIGRDGRAVASVVGEADWHAERERRWVAALL